MKDYDVVIIGSGPAGMFSAYELVNKKENLKILIIDKGKSIDERNCPMVKTGKCVNCEPCNIMCGVGGSGTFSDGTLNLRPDIGGDLTSITKNERYSWQLVEEVDKVFLKFGAPEKIYGNSKKVDELKRKAASVGVKFVDIKQRHIGSDNAPKVIKKFYEYLKKKKVEFLLNTNVKELIVKDNKCLGVITEKEEIKAKVTLLAPGRVGASWVDSIVRKYKLRAGFLPIDVGVRVEVPSIIMDPIIEINRDPKFHIRSKRYDDFVRTFCTNHRGFVVKENYNGMIGVNGHSMINEFSENTNFAFLVKVALTKPVENTIEYGKSIAKLATTIGGGKPILQRIGDLRRGRRSHLESIQKNPLQPTLQEFTPGDISMALPHRIVMDIIEGLEKLNDVIPGVNEDSTLLYAPEIKFYATSLEIDENLETSVKGLFAAGDGVGLSRDLVNASATGILAARGILNFI
ncbi:MAG: NAD(P)/FAD-dependent oxidoreductase [Candidatus Altiarchaeota archaeon]